MCDAGCAVRTTGNADSTGAPMSTQVFRYADGKLPNSLAFAYVFVTYLGGLPSA